MSASYHPRFNNLNPAQMEQQIAAKRAAEERRHATAAAAAHREADRSPNPIGADDSAYDASNSTPSSSGPTLAHVTPVTPSYDGSRNPTSAAPTSKLGRRPGKSATVFPDPNRTPPQGNNLEFYPDPNRDAYATSSTNNRPHPLLPQNPVNLPRPNHYRPPPRGALDRPQGGWIPSRNTESASSALAADPFTDAAAIPESNDSQIQIQVHEPRPKPLKARKLPHYKRKSFLAKGLAVTNYPLVIGEECPLCQQIFDIQNALAPREMPARVMMTVRRCGCNFHRGCVEQYFEQHCPQCEMKWWTTGLGTWIAKVTKPDVIVAAGRPGRAFVAPRPRDNVVVPVRKLF